MTENKDSIALEIIAGKSFTNSVEDGDGIGRKRPGIEFEVYLEVALRKVRSCIVEVNLVLQI